MKVNGVGYHLIASFFLLLLLSFFQYIMTGLPASRRLRKITSSSFSRHWFIHFQKLFFLSLMIEENGANLIITITYLNIHFLLIF